MTVDLPSLTMPIEQEVAAAWVPSGRHSQDLPVSLLPKPTAQRWVS